MVFFLAFPALISWGAAAIVTLRLHMCKRIKDFFSPAIYGLQGANFFKLHTQDKIRKPTRGFSVSQIPKAILVIVLLLWGQLK